MTASPLPSRSTGLSAIAVPRRPRRPGPIAAAAALLAALAAPACVVDDDDELASESEAIINGSPAPSWIRAHAVSIAGNCTGTLIDSNHVLTASHCVDPQNPDQVVWAYPTTSLSVDFNTPRHITHWEFPDGVVPGPIGPYYDDDGDFADMAVVTLDAPFPFSNVTPATLAWQYPGGGVQGFQVGQGFHDGLYNPSHRLESVTGLVIDSTDSDGDFLTYPNQTNPGDSGGPFYVGQKVIGTLTGDINPYINQYTSVPHRLAWVLDAMAYVWPYGPVRSGRAYSSADVTATSGLTLRECEYRCDHTSACVAFDYYAAIQRCRHHWVQGSVVPGLGTVVGTK